MKLFPRRSHLLDFHRPNELGSDRPLTPESIACLRNLSSYKRPKAYGRLPRSRSAAVLVALFIGRGGDLYVLLSRRSDGLRSYPGDTSLPGGKLEQADRSLENAARREAFEEIGLPLNKNKVPLLCILEPFLAGNHIIVTPVVVLILDQTLRPILNKYEVQSLFSHPLLGFLETAPVREPEPRVSQGHSSPPSFLRSPSLTSIEGRQSQVKPIPSSHTLKSPVTPYHTYRDIMWHGLPVRMHVFLTGREGEGVKPISGLTSAILIHTAQIGYARDPAYELNAPGQASLLDRIAVAIQQEASLQQACQEEGIEGDWVGSHGSWRMRLTTHSPRGRL